MAKKPITRSKRPLILVGTGYEANQVLVGLAREWEWDLVDLRMTYNSIPHNPVPRGAILDDLPDSERVARLLQMGCAVVRYGKRPHPLDDRVPAVLPDLAEVGRQAARHFLERNFRNLGFVGHNPTFSENDAYATYEAFVATARAHGARLFSFELGQWREKGETRETALIRRQHELTNWVADLPKPFGVLCFSDLMGGLLSFICLQHGILVPDQTAVLGIGNCNPECEMSPVALSSVDTAADERARQAMLLLKRMMQGESISNSPILVRPAGVVVRRSTHVLAVEDPNVGRAMRFIWDHFAQDLSVDDVAREVGLSQRSLQRAFQKHLRRGINAELQRMRLSHLCELLLTTDETISDLATRTGFRSAHYLQRAFKKAHGMTPRRWRQLAHETQQD